MKRFPLGKRSSPRDLILFQDKIKRKIILKNEHLTDEDINQILKDNDHGRTKNIT